MAGRRPAPSRPPHSVAVDSEGNLFIAADDDVIREVNASTGVITTVVGDGMQGYTGDGGPATAAELNDPSGIAFDSHGDLFIADMYNDVVREVAGLSPPTSTQGPPPNQTPPPTPPPIAKLERVGLMNVRTGKNKTTEVIELHFSEALNAGNAQNTSDFSLVTIPKKKKQRSAPVALAGASYNAANFTVILTPRKRLVLNPPIRLTVVATSLLDAEDRPLDAGVNIVAVLSPNGARITSEVL